jgi:general secretion pathway protein F
VNEFLGPITLVLLVIPAIALRIAVRALYGRRSLASADPMRILLSLASTIMFVLAALGIAAGVWILIIPLPIVAVVVMLMVVTRSRQAEHRALLSSLAVAAQHEIPLSEAARAFADETLGDTGVRSLALAEAIERGEPLSLATRQARLRMGTATKLAVRLGERLGSLGPAMRQQLDDSQQVDIALRTAIGRFIHLWALIVVMTGVTSFVMLKIVPVYQKMFEEFGVQLPAMTRALINVSNWFVKIGWLLTAPLSLLAPILIIGAVLYYVGWFPRNLPLVWWLFRRYDGALVMRGLALTIQRGLPLPAGLRLIADNYPLSIIGQRVRSVAHDAEQGMPWSPSLRRTDLISSADAAVLAAAERVGNLPWALEEMADSAIRRQAYRVQAAVHVLYPLLLLALGFVVFFIVAGLFVPIVALIQGLT